MSKKSATSKPADAPVKTGEERQGMLDNAWGWDLFYDAKNKLRGVFDEGIEKGTAR